MGIPISTLGNLGRVLIGFNGSTTRTWGQIILSIEVGPKRLFFSHVKPFPIKFHIGTSIDSQNEGYPLKLSLKSQLPY